LNVAGKPSTKTKVRGCFDGWGLSRDALLVPTYMRDGTYQYLDPDQLTEGSFIERFLNVHLTFPECALNVP
jgi:hypothetical protein